MGKLKDQMIVADEIIDKQLPDEISIIWSIEDIQYVDDSLSDNEARELLRLLKKYHDANVGINWEVIESMIDIYRSTMRHLESNERK